MRHVRDEYRLIPVFGLRISPGDEGLGGAPTGRRDSIDVLPRAMEPDTYVELPFVWPESPAHAPNASTEIPPAPIVELVTRKPWLLANLYSGRIPQHEEVLCAKD